MENDKWKIPPSLNTKTKSPRVFLLPTAPASYGVRRQSEAATALWITSKYAFSAQSKAVSRYA
jgi:hypothetical protein